jgi:hypothetical protein
MTKKVPQIPTSLKIGMHSVKVTAMSKETWDLSDQAGGHDGDMLEIIYHKGLPPTAILECIWHEAMHAIFAATKLTNADKEAVLEEEMVDRTTPLVLMMMRDNPQLMKWVDWYCKL